MSKWDKYRVAETPPSSDKWGKYRVASPMPIENSQKDSWPSLIGKSALKGLSAIGDVPRLVAEGVQGISNAGAKMKGSPVGLYGMGLRPDPKRFEIDQNAPQTDWAKNVPTTTDMRQGIKDYTGVDLEPNPSSPAQRIVSNAAEFGGSMTPFGLAGKSANLFSRFKKAGNLTKSGAAIGGVSGTAQEAGINPLASDIGASIIAPAATPKNLLNAFKNAGNSTAKIPMKLMGLSPKGLNLETGLAARDLGIDLPAAVLTESKLTNLADQYVGKTPGFGEMLSKKYEGVKNQTRDALENIYNEVGAKRTPEVDNRISQLYKERTASLPEHANIKPTHLKEALDKIKVNTALLSSDEKSLLDSLGTLRNEIEPASSLVSKFGNIKLPLQEMSVDKLIGTKTSLNNIIKWGKDEGVKNQLKSVRHAITEDIAEYGKTNPEWYKTFKDADKLYGDVARREKLENALSNKSTNHATNDFSYNALAKAINDPERIKAIKSQVSPEVFEKIQKLGTVAKAMAIKNKNIPNPSGTTTTAAITGVMLWTAANPLKGLPTIGAGYGATKALTSKKFLDLAVKFAENPKNLNTSMAMSDFIKKSTGYSPVVLQRELMRQQQDSE